MKYFRVSGPLIITLLIIFSSCEEPDSFSDIPPNDKARIEAWSGVLARHWLLPDCEDDVPSMLDSGDIQSLIDLCDSHPEAWAYLYSCMADTISILEPPPATCQI